MDKENGNLVINFIPALGNTINHKARDLLNQHFHNIKVTLKMDINMEKEFKFLIMETDMKVFILMENLKEKELIIGVMAQYIKASSRMVFALDMVFGSLAQKNIKDHT